MPAKILKCTCKHEAQDALHGKNMRVFNMSGKDPAQGKCTVCGNKLSSGATVKVTAKPKK